MDIILKDLSLDQVIYLKCLIVKHQNELMATLRSLDINDPSRQDLFDEINKIDFLVLNMF